MKAWESFQNFRLTYKFSLNEAPTIEHVVNYIAYLSLNGYAAATLSTYIAGLSFHFRSHGLQDVTQSFIVKRMLEGSRRGRTTRDVRCPITMPTLKRLLFALPHVCISAYDVLLFRAAFLIAFFAFLRVGEFTVRARDHAPTLRLTDVNVRQGGGGGGGLELCIRSSKTDQKGAGCRILLPGNNTSDLCPVHAACEHLTLRPRGGGGGGGNAFFVRFDGSPLVRSDFNVILKRCVEFVDLPVQFFSAHSFRIGAVTSAAMLGVSDAMIRNMGRWSSNTFKRYSYRQNSYLRLACCFGIAFRLGSHLLILTTIMWLYVYVMVRCVMVGICPLLSFLSVTSSVPSLFLAPPPLRWIPRLSSLLSFHYVADAAKGRGARSHRAVSGDVALPCG